MFKLDGKRNNTRHLQTYGIDKAVKEFVTEGNNGSISFYVLSDTGKTKLKEQELFSESAPGSEYPYLVYKLTVDHEGSICSCVKVPRLQQGSSRVSGEDWGLNGGFGDTWQNALRRRAASEGHPLSPKTLEAMKRSDEAREGMRNGDGARKC